jgi:hypothetical protein
MTGENDETRGDVSATATSSGSGANSAPAAAVDTSTTPSQGDVARPTSKNAFTAQYVSTLGSTAPSTVRIVSSFQGTQSATTTSDTGLPTTPPALPSPTADFETTDPKLTTPCAIINISSEPTHSRRATANLLWQSPLDGTQAHAPSQEITSPLTVDHAQAVTAASAAALPNKSPASKIPLVATANVHILTTNQAEAVTANPATLPLPWLPQAGSSFAPAHTATQAMILPKRSPIKTRNTIAEDQGAEDGQAKAAVTKPPPSPFKDEILGQSADAKPIVKSTSRRNQPAKRKQTKRSPPKSQSAKGQPIKKKPPTKRKSTKGQRAKGGQPAAGTTPKLPHPLDEESSHVTTIKRITDNTLSDSQPPPNKRRKKPPGQRAKKKTTKEQLPSLVPANVEPSTSIRFTFGPFTTRPPSSPLRLVERAASPHLPAPHHGPVPSFWPIDSSSEPWLHSPVNAFQLHGDGKTSPWYMINPSSQIPASSKETGNEASVATGNQTPVERDPPTIFQSQAINSTNVSYQEATSTTTHVPSPMVAAYETVEQSEHQKFEKLARAVLQQVRHAKEAATNQEWLIQNILYNHLSGHEGPTLELLQHVVSAACWQRACDDTRIVQQGMDITMASFAHAHNQQISDKKTHEAVHAPMESTMGVTGTASPSEKIQLKNLTEEDRVIACVFLNESLTKRENRETQPISFDAPLNRTSQAEASSVMTRDITEEQKHDLPFVSARATPVRADKEDLNPVLKEASSNTQVGAETPSGMMIPSLNVLKGDVAGQDEDSQATIAWKKSMDTCPHIAQFLDNPSHQDVELDEFLAVLDLDANNKEASEHSWSRVDRDVEEV